MRPAVSWAGMPRCSQGAACALWVHVLSQRGTPDLSGLMEGLLFPFYR